MKPPLVSFLVPTFGRAARQPEVINEALFWCLNQTYPKVEVVVLNDCPQQKLVCQDPRVRVFNCEARFNSLGAKMNRLIELAVGEICLPADDDDISLPFRAEQAVAGLRNFEYFTPQLWYYHHKGRPMVSDGAGVGHMAAAYQRLAFRGGYADVTKAHDALAHSWALQNLKVNPWRARSPRDVTYVYRWGTSDWHVSGHADMEYAWAATPTGPPGKYEVKPVMGEDYARMHAECCGRP